MLHTFNIKKISILLVLFLMLGTFSPYAPEHQAQQTSEDIRVALFVDIGSGYQHTVPMVSLSSETGLVLQGSSGLFNNINDASYARFSVDQYYLTVVETTQASEARQVSQQLSQKGFNNSIISLKKNNTSIYRVVTGFESQEEVLKIQQELKTQLQRESSLAGPHRVQAGRFTTMAEAKQRLTEIQSKDFVAYLVQGLENGQANYQVWVGDEVNQTAQGNLKTRLQQAFPGVSFQPAAAEEYLILTKTLIFGSQLEEIPYYWISPHKQLTIEPKDAGITPLVTVEERGNRRYRGQIELRYYKNKLTVVNILPLEHYLYSVVGTEMSTGWPVEALKSQAVMSRNYAYKHMQNNKYGIAHLSDTIYEQAYYGYGREATDVRQAVNSTRGEFLTYSGQIFRTFYHSNAGGMTAQGPEVWGFPLASHTMVSSNDQYPETVQVDWYRVQDSEGKMGYVSSAYVDKTNRITALGFTYGRVNTETLNYRTGPSTDHEKIGSLTQGDQVLIFEVVKQNNAYSWISGPFSALETMEAINARPMQEVQPILEPVNDLTVSKRGPSGRVMKMEANGQSILTSSPDSHRSIFKDGDRSLRSTRFDIESMGEYSVIGAGGSQVNVPQQEGQPLYTLSAGTSTAIEVNPEHNQFAVYNSSGRTRIVSKEPAFRFHGYGFGHGLGASQWGMREMAAEGHDYHQILKHYFHKDSVIEKRYQ